MPETTKAPYDLNSTCPWAGKTVRIKEGCTHFQVPDFAGSEYRVEDWWKVVGGKSWMFCDGNPACLVYAMRTGLGGNIPIDDQVVYGKIGSFGHLVHVSEIEVIEEPT